MASGTPPAPCTTASWLPWRRADVNTSSRVYGSSGRERYLSQSKSRGGFCSNQSRSCSGVSWRNSGVSSSSSAGSSSSGRTTPSGGAPAATAPGWSSSRGAWGSSASSSTSHGSSSSASGTGGSGGGSWPGGCGVSSATSGSSALPAATAAGSSPSGCANSARCGEAPSASRSWRWTSSGSAPCRRLSSRCSRMASSSSPMPRLRRLLGPDGAVLTGPLRTVQRGVRGRDQGVLAVARGRRGERGSAERGGHLERAVALQQRQVERLDPPPDALRELEGTVEIGLGQRDRHLLAAVAGGLVDLARRLAQDAGDLAQDHVALQVPVGVVDALEVVDVEHDEPHLGAVALRPLDLLGDDLLEAAVVEEAGQLVRDRLALDGLVEVDVLHRHRGLVGQVGEELALARREAAVAAGDRDD